MIVSKEINSPTGTIPMEDQIGEYYSFPEERPELIDERTIPHDFPELFKPPKREIDEISKRLKTNVRDEIITPDSRYLQRVGAASSIPRFPLPPVAWQPYEISKIASDFIKEQKRAFALNKSLDTVAEGILRFMKSQNIEARIVIDLETDPEYDDWKEPRVRVLIPSCKFEHTYRHFSELLNFSLRGIRKRDLIRFRVTLDIGER